MNDWCKWSYDTHSPYNGQFDVLIFKKWTNWYFFSVDFLFFLALTPHEFAFSEQSSSWNRTRISKQWGHFFMSWLWNHSVSLGQWRLSLGLAFSFCTMTFRLLTPWSSGQRDGLSQLMVTKSSGLTTDSLIEFLLPCLCATVTYSPAFPHPPQIQQFIPTALSWGLKKIL